MSTESTQVKPLVDIIVDEDRLRAWLQPAKGADLSDVTAELIHAELEKAKVAVDDRVENRIQDLLKKVRAGGEIPRRVLIAQGRAAVDAEDGGFEWAEHLKKNPAAPDEGEDDEGQVDHRSRNFIRTVEADEEIGTIVPPVPGRSGIDVHGNILKPGGSGQPIQLRDNVVLKDDGKTVVASAVGRVEHGHGQLGVNEVLEIRGDVDYESGNIDATSDVHIRGTVRDLFQVTSKKSVAVDGAIEAADVRTCDNLVVRGGILGRSKGKVVVDKELMAKFCEEADLRVTGDAYIEREIINSVLHVAGRLFAERGTIIGGQIYARRGIVVRTLGSDSCVPTIVRVGISPETLWKVRQIDEENKKRCEAIEHIRQMVQPLMSNVKRLSAAQKERATELLFQAETLEMEVEEAKAEQKRLLEEGDPGDEAHVLIQSHVFQRVHIAIGDRATEIAQELKGPVKIERKKMDNVTEFVAVDQMSGSIAKLTNKRIPITAPEEASDES